ncbi:hypothetical protein DL96DRAFT_840425 [Flagelloscypha sp. PMI_526]|nr:hypothetical protein DL96DRAFT_840425 [Flagelloscypha sp. PMI_526]
MKAIDIYDLSWGPTPRRVWMFMKVKGIPDNAVNRIETTPSLQGLVADGKPPGSVPLLRLPNGEFLHQSIPIIQYLDELFPDGPNMLGDTPASRARHRDLMTVADEVMTHFGSFCHNASPLFLHELQEIGAAKRSMELCEKMLGLVCEYAQPGENGAFLDGEHPKMADCILFSHVAVR